MSRAVRLSATQLVYLPAVYLAVVLGMAGCGEGAREVPEQAPARPVDEASTSVVPLPESQQRERTVPEIEPDLRERLASAEGRVIIDGSSTVFPLTEAVTRELGRLAPGIEIRLGVSGTGGGFEKFCRGEIQVADASRPIKLDELELCRRHGLEVVELPIAYDGISVVVHAENHWARCLTVDELRHLWQPEAEGRVTSWRQVREEWPDRPLVLYGPGEDSGTYDYFTKSIVGSEGSSRRDFVGSEDDYLIAQDVASDPAGLGFFGAAYYQEYRHVLTLVSIDPGTGCVEPTPENIAEGRYRPLSRPIFLYTSLDALEELALRALLDYYLERVGALAAEVGYVPLPDLAYGLARRRLAEGHGGSLFDGGSQVDVSITELLRLASEEPIP